MGLGIVVFLWLILGAIIVVPIVLVRLLRLYKAGDKTGYQKWRAAMLNFAVGGVAIILIGFWMPIMIMISEATDTPEKRFIMVFGFEPPAEIEILQSSSHYSSDWTDAYVVFSATTNQFSSIIPTNFSKITRAELSGAPGWPSIPACDGELIFEERPWTGGQFHSSSMAMVVYCPETEIAHAGGVGVD